MLAKLDWKDIITWLLFFVPGVLKGVQAALGANEKLDLVTLIMIVVPVLVGSFAVLKVPGSATAAAVAPVAAAKPAQAAVLGFKPGDKKK